MDRLETKRDNAYILQCQKFIFHYGQIRNTFENQEEQDYYSYLYSTMDRLETYKKLDVDIHKKNLYSTMDRLETAT